MIDWNSKEVGENGEILVFELSGRLDAIHCDYLFSVLESRIEDGRTKLILDCSDLEYISSMGLGMLMRVHSRMNQRGPRAMGWRTNGRNLNLNRDFAKLETEELRALARAVNAWRPDL